MTVSQQVIWTLLPQGFMNATTLGFTVLVSPRLSSSAPNPTIADFPDWLDWPQTLSKAKFHLVVDGAGPGAPITPLHQADSATWKRMVGHGAHVDSYKFRDLSKVQLLSYPIARLASLIEGIYGPIGAQSPTSLPTRDALLLITRELASALGSRNEVFGSFKNGFITADTYGSDAGALRLLTAYHTPLNKVQTQSNMYNAPGDPRRNLSWTNYRQTPLPTPAQLASSIDFHKIVTSVIEHRDLSLWMGLVLAFEVPASLVPDGSHTLSLLVDRGLGPSPDIYPQTQITKKGPVFEAQIKSASGPLVGRYLNLQAPGGFDLVQMDVDGGALKLKNLAQAAPTLPTTGYDDQDFATPRQVAGLPSLRSAGLMLAQARRYLDAESRFDGSAKLQQAVEQNAPLPVLYAEDLLRGYRVDVLDKTANSAWRSLMARQVSFTFTVDGTKHAVAEEGMMRFSGGGSTDGSNSNVLKIHEGVFVWRGWSLAAPEPFQALAVDPSTVPGSDPQGDAPPAGLPLSTAFTPVKGSLPQLRFGHSYEVRVRTVDLTGFSLTSGDPAAPAQSASNSVVYRRYEPVEPPAIVLPAPGGVPVATADGESMGRAAVRSFNATPAQNTVVNTGRAVRLIAAPRVSVRFAETHGVLDTAAGKLDPAAYAMLAAKDKDFAVDPPNPPVTTPPTPPPTPQRAIADPTAPLPYLPDPFASAVAITISGLDGVDPTHVFAVPLYPNGTVWPNAAPFQIVGGETIGGVGFDAAQRQFLVPLRKGERAVLKLSCVIPETRVSDMAMAVLIASQPNVNVQQIGQIILSGQHWMLTPWTTLELVHAVQKPLVTPDLTKVKAVREAGLYAVDAYLLGQTPISAHSTAKIDLEASWSEPDDEPLDAAAATAPAVVQSRLHAAELNLSRNVAANGALPFDGAMKHSFPDTRYRRVFYALSATSRYREFMTPAIRAVDGATTVTSTEARRWIVNTAPPPAPKVLYVIPTFGWSRSASGGQSVSVRSGGGLRVYLDRPWFATGFGEMLGVVLPDAGTSTADADTLLKTDITQWGRDPIWSSAAVNTLAPDPSAFPLAKWAGPIGFDASGATNTVPSDVIAAFQAEHADLPPGNFTVTGLTAPGLPAGKTVAVAPHAVGFDADRQLWYCDIVIRPPAQAYYPFVRLALARYQPTSAGGASLSAAVMSEFQQLTPDRMAVVSQSGGPVSQASISIYGFAPQDSGGAAAAVFRATTQVLDAGADADLDWRDAAGSATPVPKGAKQVTQTAAASSTRLGAQFNLPAQVQQAIAKGDIGSIGVAGLTNQLAPALLWTWQGYLPVTPSGGRRRVLITESESYATATSNQRGERIVYAEAIEI